MFSYNLERVGGKFTVTPAGYILVNDKIDRETEDVHSFQVSRLHCQQLWSRDTRQIGIFTELRAKNVHLKREKA